MFAPWRSQNPVRKTWVSDYWKIIHTDGTWIAWYRAIFVWPWKVVSVSVHYFFISQWMKRSKHGLFVFPPKKTLIWRRHPSIGQWCCSMTSKRSIDWFLESSRAWEVFSPERSLNQSKATSVCIRSTNQSYCSISVRLFFFCFVRAFSFQGHTKIALNTRGVGRIRYNYALTLDFVSGLHNCLEFSQPLECLYQDMQTQEKCFVLLL